MADQYLAYREETTRGTDPTSGEKFLPITGKLTPDFKAVDEPRNEFRGASTGLGSSTIIRRETSWSHTLESYYYPGAEIGTLLKHLIGYAGSRSTVDTSAKSGILYPVEMPYGTGMAQVNKAIGIIPNTDEAGTTKSQYFGGGRIKSATLVFKGSDDVKISFEIGGPGGYIGAVDQTAIANPSYPAADCFNSSNVTVYIGSGITRTGTAPNYTAFAPNTMSAFTPDDLTIKITNGLEDVDVIDAVRGPSLTRRTSQFKIEVDFTVDYSDPAAGFSSADEYKALFAAVKTNAMLIKLDNGDLAGDATQTYQTWIDLPNLMITAETPDRNSEGKTAMVKFKGTSLWSDTTEYPIGILTFDKAAAY